MVYKISFFLLCSYEFNPDKKSLRYVSVCTGQYSTSLFDKFNMFR